MNATNLKVKNISQILKDINKSGTKYTAFGKFGDYIHNTDAEHVQGAVLYNGLLVISHNREKGMRGFYAVMSSSSFKTFDLDCSYEHASSMQLLGNYMLIVCETHSSSPRKFKCLLYDLSELSVEKGAKFVKEIVLPDQDKHGAASVGVANYTAKDKDGTHKNYYMISVAEGSKQYFYKSQACTDINDAVFTFDGKFIYSKDMNYENIALVCDSKEPNDKVYLLAMKSDSSYDDYVDLYAVDPSYYSEEKAKHPAYERFHFSSVNKLDTGNLQHIHFRWGASIRVLGENSIEVIATERDSANKDEKYLDYNIWKK